MAEKRFPVAMKDGERAEFPECPRSVPWSLVAPHEKQARHNHDRSLEQLAEAGGLSPKELVFVLEDRPYDVQCNQEARLAYSVQALAAVAVMEAAKADAGKR